MGQQPQSPELAVFQEKWDDISKLISDNIYDDLGLRAFAKGLIPEISSKTMSNPTSHLAPNVRTSLFMNELKCSIIDEPRMLERFIDMLEESNDVYYATLIRNIRKFSKIYWLAIFL